MLPLIIVSVLKPVSQFYDFSANYFAFISSSVGMVSLSSFARPSIPLSLRSSAIENQMVSHGRSGQRDLKFINGQSVEAYDWYDLIRLDAAATYEQYLSFHYNKGERVPLTAGCPRP